MTSQSQIILKDGTAVTIIEKEKEDVEQMARFFSKLPYEDRLFLRRDVSRREVLEERAREFNEGRVFRIAALKDGELVAEASLYKTEYGWQRHIGEMRLVVARDYQRNGLGSQMANQIFLAGIRLNYKVVMVYLLEEDLAALHCVEKLGFKKEITLEGFARDFNDKKHNLLVMSFNIENMWKAMEDFNEGYAIHSEV